jgi:hypothetical protein
MSGAVGIILPTAIGDSLMSLPAVWMIAEHFHAQRKLIVCSRGSVAMFRRMQIPHTEFTPDTGEALSPHVPLACLFDFRSTRSSHRLVRYLAPERLYSHAFAGGIGGHHYEIDGVAAPAVTFAPGWESRPSAVEDSAWAFDAGLVAASFGMAPPTEHSLRSSFHAFSSLQGWSDEPSCGPVVFVPGGGAQAKKWPSANWHHLGKSLLRRGLEIHVSLGPDDTDPLPKDLPHLTYSGLGLDSLSRRFQESMLVVANDCGPMHIAAVFGCRLIAIFGPTNERIWFPYGGQQQFAMRSGARNPDRNGLLANDFHWKDWPRAEDVARNVLDLIGGATGGADYA